LGKRHLLTTPSTCPRSGKVKLAGLFDFTDGKVATKGSAACRR